MSFYYESEDLNLRKKYNNLCYDELEDKSLQQVVYTIPEQQLTNTQQSEQLIAESQILQRDVRNICVYFTQRYIVELNNPQLQLFPFIKIKNRICHIFEKYQEQSSLLDNLLEGIVVPLMEVVKVYVLKAVGQKTICEEFHNLCDIVYILSKVRGVRSISRYCPHQVSDLEPVMMYLQMTSAELNQSWESKYIILMWLSIIVLVPFDLSSIDSNLIQVEQLFTTSNSIIACLLNLGVKYLRSSTKLRNMGSLYLSKLFSRADVLKSSLLREFVEWSVAEVLKEYQNVLSTFYVTGLLETLVEILKSGQRNELKGELNRLLPLLSIKSNGTLINLYLTKLTQRLGLVQLRPRIIDWTYKKGTSNLQSVSNGIIDHSKLVTNASQQQVKKIHKQSLLSIEAVDYFADVEQESLEIVIDTLLQQLTQKDTVVRWSAAKGIGRICSRLDLDQADDVFEALLQTCFTPINGDTAWHGGCLALGELCRRNLITPVKLPIVIPIICKALVFEQNQGGYSIGVNVRDSACYIAWSTARAYDPQILVNQVLPLAQQLVTLMLFDREVNVRRAASSTYQELVGRCPNIIPHGIAILTESDYFSLALIHNAYLRIAPFVGSFEEYYKSLVDHLAFVKVISQDQEVRKLAAKGLSRLFLLNPQYCMDNGIYQGLLDLIEKGALSNKHGSLYAIGDLLIAQSGNAIHDRDEKELKDSVFLRTLTKNEKELSKAGEHISIFKTKYQELLKSNNMNLLDNDLIQRIIEIPQSLENSLKGKQGEQLRIAVNRLIECIALAALPLSPEQHRGFLKFLEDGLRNPLEDIQNSAVKALTLVSGRFQNDGEYLQDGVKFLQRILGQLSQQQVKGGVVVIVSGLAQAVGAFNAEVIKQCDISILERLGLSKKRSKLSSWSLDPDTRKYAVKSIGLCFASLLRAQFDCTQRIPEVINTLLYAMQDYTVNKRGDVGLFIRENAIISLQAILIAYVQYQNLTKCEPIQINKIAIIGALLQQLCEKIDRVRLLAGSVLQDLFRQVFNKLPQFENEEIIAEVFSTPYLQLALTRDQERVDQSFQSEIIEAEIKNLKERLLNFSKTELIYHWNQPHCCYRLIVPLLRVPQVRRSLLLGLCVSAGGISESIQKSSESAIMELTELAPILETMLDLARDYIQEERVFAPLLKTAAIVLQREDETFPKDLLLAWGDLLYNEINTTQSINKMASSVQLIVDLLSRTQAPNLYQLVQNILGSDFPKVRKSLADAFYLLLLSLEDETLISPEKSENLQEFLLETDWLSDEIDKHLIDFKEKIKELF